MSRPTAPQLQRAHLEAPTLVDAVRILERGRDTCSLEIVCPHCGELHYHGGAGGPGQGDGHRASHCITDIRNVGYVLREVGAREGRTPLSARIRQRLGIRGRSPRQPISVATRTRILERDGFRCRRCGAGPRDDRLVIDHIVPVALGGSGDDANLQTLCEPCNQGKSDRPPHPHDLESR